MNPAPPLIRYSGKPSLAERSKLPIKPDLVSPCRPPDPRVTSEVIEEQDRLIAERSGTPAIAVKSVHRSGSKKPDERGRHSRALFHSARSMRTLLVIIGAWLVLNVFLVVAAINDSYLFSEGARKR